MGGNPAVVTDPVNSGSYALKCNATARVDKGRLSGTDVVFVRGYFRLSANPPNGNNVVVLRAYDNASREIYYVEFRQVISTLRIQFSRRFPSLVSTDYVYNYSANTWYCIEVKFHRNAASGEYRVYLDGSEIITGTGLNTTGCGQLDRIRVGQAPSTYPVTVYIDDIVVDEEYIGPLPANTLTLNFTSASNLDNLNNPHPQGQAYNLLINAIDVDGISQIHTIQYRVRTYEPRGKIKPKTLGL